LHYNLSTFDCALSSYRRLFSAFVSLFIVLLFSSFPHRLGKAMQHKMLAPEKCDAGARRGGEEGEIFHPETAPKPQPSNV
jgi:hypothetical protein